MFTFLGSCCNQPWHSYPCRGEQISETDTWCRMGNADYLCHL